MSLPKKPLKTVEIGLDQGMVYYIDTENTDMRQLAFETVKGIDLPVWKDVQSADEIEIKKISGSWMPR